MRTIDAHPVRFGELAGPLVHGSMVFDWELISTQEIADTFDYPFEQIVAEDGIPYAPVVVSTTVERYPTFEDTVTVETDPINVGESSVELRYRMVDGDGNPLATARIIHVTIAPEGGAQPLPDETRTAFDDALVDENPVVGPASDLEESPDEHPTFSTDFEIRGPHVEGSVLAYFEEYPRFAAIALEEFLESQGPTLGDFNGEKQPFRLRDWRWQFNEPVHYERTLTVECDVTRVTDDTVRVAHTFSTGDAPLIEGVTDYGCFDRDGRSTTFEHAALDAFGERDVTVAD